MRDNTKNPEYRYFRVLVTYFDGETSGHRVFKDRAEAEIWAKRQKKSAVVKEVAVEPFTWTVPPTQDGVNHAPTR